MVTPTDRPPITQQNKTTELVRAIQMSTLPLDNTFEDPRQRAPLVLGHTDFGSVTEEIRQVNESPKPPTAWYVALGISSAFASLPRNVSAAVCPSFAAADVACSVPAFVCAVGRRKALYVAPGFTHHLEEVDGFGASLPALSEEESQAVLGSLLQSGLQLPAGWAAPPSGDTPIEGTPNLYAHRWVAGDLLIWNNRCAMR